jgi:flagellar biosynthesis/type III secretory pathway protein FliH
VVERFIPLAAFVRAAGRAGEPEAPARAEGAAAPPAPQRAEPPRAATPHPEALQELALMRSAALEAYERARLRLLEALAHEVLARELLLAPADIALLARRALETFSEAEPLTLVLAPEDAERVALPLPVRADPALEPGDLIVEVRDGELESRFAFRARRALEEAAGSA